MTNIGYLDYYTASVDVLRLFVLFFAGGSVLKGDTYKVCKQVNTTSETNDYKWLRNNKKKIIYLFMPHLLPHKAPNRVHDNHESITKMTQ